LHEPSSTNILRLVAVNSPAAHLIRSEDEAVSIKIILSKMKRLGKLAAGFPSTLCVHVPYLLYVYQTITSAFGKLKSNGVRVRGKSRTKQSHQWQPSVLYANSPLFWFGRGDQPALSAQTRTHEMYTQKLFAAILQLLAHERSLITKRMLVKLTEKRFKKTQGEKWAMWQSED